VKILFIVLFIVCSFNAQAQTMSQSIMVMDGWIRLTPPIAKNSAAYFTLHNMSDKAVTLVEVKTEIAETAMMHDVVIDKSMARMVHLPELTIDSGDQVIFAPGGKHLMLVNLTQKLSADQEVKLTFSLKSGEIITTTMKVMKEYQPSSAVHQHD